MCHIPGLRMGVDAERVYIDFHVRLRLADVRSRCHRPRRMGWRPPASTAKGRTERTYTIRVKQRALDTIQKSGFVYSFQHEVKKPGPYQMRVAVLDDAFGRVGSGSRYIDVPDLNKGALALSSISMRDGEERPSEHTVAEGQEFDPSPALRVFHRGHPFTFGVTVYNARLGVISRQPALELQARLIRDNRVVWEGKRFPVVLPAGGDARRIPPEAS